jgi:hypothetical protein
VKGFQFTALSLLTALLAAGCGAAPDQEEVGKVDQWLGDKLHFAVSGTFDGKPINIRLEGDAAKTVRCTRNYAPLPGAKPDADGKYDTSQVYFLMKECGIVTDVEGKPTDVSVGYWGHDPAAGSSLEVIPRATGSTIPEGKVWVDFELSEPGATGPTGIEKAAEGGTFAMKLNSGTPDQNGVFIPTGGRTGEFFSINWGPQERLTISLTSDCEDALFAPWGTRIAPPPSR